MGSLDYSPPIEKTFEETVSIVHENFVHNLKLLRVEKGLTGIELSGILKLSGKRINDLEGKRMPPNFEDLVKIVDYFDICFDDLLGYKIPLNIGSKQNIK